MSLFTSWAFYIFVLSKYTSMKEISGFLVAAPGSGSGKTTVTLGLLRAIKNRGITVQPFKCGPDYIDTKYHDIASGNKSVNLDLFLSSEDHIKSLFLKYSLQSDVSIVEGVMGLFDGYDKMKGSSAEIAEKLNMPVVLVVNAKAMAYSAAPLLYGFKNFYKNVNILGVIFNFVSSESHYDYLKKACEDVGVEVLGYLPKDANIEVPSRHLGLTLDKKYQFEEFADKIAVLTEKYIDIDKLLSVTKRKIETPEEHQKGLPSQKLRIAVASDEAFNFVYHENIGHLERLGNVSFFSPLRDTEIPETDFIYLPGGYPELYLDVLSNNKSMINSIKGYIERGGKLLAECGGMMYLSSSIADNDGKEYTMVGVFNQKATMQNMKLKLGYRQLEYNNIRLKGHEFHYSTVEGDLDSIARQYGAKGQAVDTKLLRYKNALAGYTHLYWAEMDNVMDIFNILV